MSADGAIAALPWDSDFFGFSIARVLATRPDAAQLDAAIAACQAQSIRCAYLLLDAADHDASACAEARGFVLRDVRVQLDRRIAPSDADSPRAAEAAIAEAQPAQHDALLQLARRRFTDSRFFADPHFPRERCHALYAQFLLRAFGDDASRVTLATPDAHGFIVCHADAEQGIGAIELIAVSDAVAGRGVGLALVNAANRRFAQLGLERAIVVTQGSNISAQRIYQRSGYRTADTGLWFHRWFERRDTPGQPNGSGTPQLSSRV